MNIMSQESFDIEAALEKCHPGTAWQRDLIREQLTAAIAAERDEWQKLRDPATLLAHIQRGAVPSADQLWNNDEVMALNAELGLTMNQIERLVRAAMLTAELAWCRSQQPS